MDREYRVVRKVHPKDTANVFSLISFAYILDIIKAGKKKDLQEDDVCNVMKRFQSEKLGNRFEKCWQNQKAKCQDTSLLRLLATCYGKRFTYLSISQLVARIITILITPWALGNFVKYFKLNQTTITLGDAYFYGVVIILINVLHTLYDQQYRLMKTEMAIEMMMSISSLIYRKAMRLSSAKLSEISTGKIVTAITKDITTLEDAIFFGNDIFIDAVQAFVIFVLLYLKVGVTAFAGFGLIIVSIPIQAFVGWMNFKKRGESNARTDERLQYTKETLSSIRIIKMYMWEKFFGKRILHAREKEVEQLRYVFILKAMSYSVGFLTAKLSYFLVIITHLWLGNDLTAELIAYLTSIFLRLKGTVIHSVPHATTALGNVTASLNRMNLILNTEEYEEPTRQVIRSPNPCVEFMFADVTIDSKTILKSISFHLKSGLNILYGPVGCGKSALLKTILGEHPLAGGKTNVEGAISYSPQNPWIFPSSIKQNILFGQPYNKTRYQMVLSVTALKYDLDIFKEGDDTILTDCGINLSKGQQARINLARAVYKDSDIYLLDDCFSALDQQVENYTFQHCMKSYLKDKLILLVTHTTRHLPEADNVICMSEGTIISSGRPKDLLKKLDDSDKEIEDTKERSTQDKNEDDYAKLPKGEESELLEKHNTSQKNNIYHETLYSGSVRWRTYMKYCKYGGGICLFLLGVLTYISVEGTSAYSDKLLSKWVILEEKITYMTVHHNFSYIEENGTSQTTMMESHYGLFDNDTHAQTPNSSQAPFSNILTTIDSNYSRGTAVTVPSEIFNVTDDFLPEASESKLEEMMNQSKTYSSVYSIIVLVVCSLIILAPTIFVFFTMRASKLLHESMVTHVLNATMAFFDKNMLGNLLNRFAKDLQIIDDLMPTSFIDGIRQMTTVFTITILVGSINLIFLVYSLILGVIYLLLSWYYLQTGRNLRRLDSATRSPIVGHLNAMLEGLVTIRAHGTRSILIDEFDKHQDLFTATHHLMEIALRGLTFALDMVSNCYLCAIILHFLMSEPGQLSGNVGLAVSQALMLGHFLEWSTIKVVTLEGQMTSLERALEYTEVQQETTTGQKPDNWPDAGSVKFQKVNLTYRTNNEKVLKNLTFTINPKEKIGIVGRTGAGKSSILSTIYRLYDIEGDILIDDVNIKTVSLEYLRTRIAIIPQDPVIFTGSIRNNLDPLGQCNDRDIWQALDEVNLKAAVADLDQDIVQSGLNFSVGQKQLICLARAILRKSKIVILDEATANMDESMDNFISEKISKLFESCTMIIVAHRLNSVKTCNRVMVMDKGEIKEFSNPGVLLENKESAFYKMVHDIID